MSKHTEHSDVRIAILSVAAEMFARLGVHASGIAEISKAASLSKGTLYYYYPTKDSLVIDVLELHLSEFSDIMLEWVNATKSDSTLTDAITQLVTELMQCDILLHSALICEAARNSDALLPTVERWYNELFVLFEIGLLKMSSVSFGGNRTLARMFFTLIDGYLMQSAMGIPPFDIDVLIKNITDIYS